MGIFLETKMLKKTLIASLFATLACGANAADKAQDTIPLMVVQSVDVGHGADRVEEIFGQNLGEKKGKKRTYALNILNSANSVTTSCVVDAKFKKNKESSELELEQLKWNSGECQKLVALSGYELYAESKAYKQGDSSATIFFEYKDSTFDENLNKIDMKMLVKDLHDRGIKKVNLTAYQDETIGVDQTMAISRAMTIKQTLQLNGYEGEVTINNEKVQKQQTECLKDTDCLVKPWVVLMDFIHDIEQK